MGRLDFCIHAMSLTLYFAALFLDCKESLFYCHRPTANLAIQILLDYYYYYYNYCFWNQGAAKWPEVSSCSFLFVWHIQLPGGTNDGISASVSIRVAHTSTHHHHQPIETANSQATAPPSPLLVAIVLLCERVCCCYIWAAASCAALHVQRVAVHILVFDSKL